MKRPTVVLALLAAAAAGCGGNGHGADFGAPSDVYPAPHPPMAQVRFHGGAIQAHPKFVAVTYDDDLQRAQEEAFLATLGGTPYWSAATAEYGISPAVLTTSLHLAGPAPASLTQGEVAGTLAGFLDGSHPEWPAPDDDTTYFLFYPPTTAIGSPQTGQSCIDFGAYHSLTNTAQGAASYAVIPTCLIQNVPTLEITTLAASHEALEAATDPFATGYWNAVGNDDGVWDLVSFGGELGDYCEWQPDSLDPDDGGGYVVQRTWSNAAAAAGHDPCVKAASGPFVAAAPEVFDHASLIVGLGLVSKTNAVKIPVGTKKTITLDLYSDAPTDGPFTVGARDGASTFFGNAPVEVVGTLDRPTGVNGEKVHLTIEHKRAGSASYFGTGGSVLIVTAKYKSRQFWWPVWVSD